MNNIELTSQQRRVHRTARVVKYVAVFCWLSIIWGVRGLSDNSTVVFVLGFAPDFFASVALYFDAADRAIRGRGFAAISTKSFRWTVAIGVVVLLFVGELLQEYVLDGHFDLWDVTAHIVGALISLMVLQWLTNGCTSSAND